MGPSVIIPVQAFLDRGPAFCLALTGAAGLGCGDAGDTALACGLRLRPIGLISGSLEAGQAVPGIHILQWIGCNHVLDGSDPEGTGIAIGTGWRLQDVLAHSVAFAAEIQGRPTVVRFGPAGCADHFRAAALGERQKNRPAAERLAVTERDHPAGVKVGFRCHLDQRGRPSRDNLRPRASALPPGVAWAEILAGQIDVAMGHFAVAGGGLRVTPPSVTLLISALIQRLRIVSKAGPVGVRSKLVSIRRMAMRRVPRAG